MCIHNIITIFSQLSHETKKSIEDMYQDQTNAFSAIKATRHDQGIKLGDIVQLASLEQALESNKETIKNFKYDNKFQGTTSVVGNAIWDDDTIWILPSAHKPFAEALFEFAKKRT